jgi:hypothetical protein
VGHDAFGESVEGVDRLVPLEELASAIARWMPSS